MYIQCARKVGVFPELDSVTLDKPHQEFQPKTLTSGTLRPPACQTMSPKSNALAHPRADKNYCWNFNHEAGNDISKPSLQFKRPLWGALYVQQEVTSLLIVAGAERNWVFPLSPSTVEFKMWGKIKNWRRDGHDQERKRGSLDWNFPLENVGNKRKRPTLLSFYPHHSPFLDWNFLSFPNMKILFGTPAYVPSL